MHVVWLLKQPACVSACVPCLLLQGSRRAARQSARAAASKPRTAARRAEQVDGRHADPSSGEIKAVQLLLHDLH